MLHAFLTLSTEVVGLGSYFEWEHSRLFVRLNERLLVSLLLDVSNVHSHALSAKFAQSKLDLLAVFKQFDLGN